MDENEIVAAWLGMSVDQIEELRRRLDVLRTNDENYGYLRIDIKKGQVFKFSHTIDGKPMFFKEENS